MNSELTCNLGVGKFDLKKFSQLLYVQRRYMEAVGITNPNFVFTLPTGQRDAVELAILNNYREFFGDLQHFKLKEATRTPTSSIIGFEMPKVSKLPLCWPMVTIVLMDQMDWDKIDA